MRVHGGRHWGWRPRGRAGAGDPGSVEDSARRARRARAGAGPTPPPRLSWGGLGPTARAVGAARRWARVARRAGRGRPRRPPSLLLQPRSRPWPWAASSSCPSSARRWPRRGRRCRTARRKSRETGGGPASPQPAAPAGGWREVSACEPTRARPLLTSLATRRPATASPRRRPLPSPPTTRPASGEKGWLRWWWCEASAAPKKKKKKKSEILTSPLSFFSPRQHRRRHGVRRDRPRPRLLCAGHQLALGRGLQRAALLKRQRERRGWGRARACGPGPPPGPVLPARFPAERAAR